MSPLFLMIRETTTGDLVRFKRAHIMMRKKSFSRSYFLRLQDHLYFLKLCDFFTQYDSSNCSAYRSIILHYIFLTLLK